MKLGVRWVSLICLECRTSLNFSTFQISDKGPIHVDDDGRLIITEVMETYAGKYTCVAENLAGKTEKSIELVVTSKLTAVL